MSGISSLDIQYSVLCMHFQLVSGPSPHFLCCARAERVWVSLLMVHKYPSENVLSFMTVGKGKGKVRRGGVQKKDNQRKRWGHVPVSVPVKGGHSVFRVSVPLSSLPSEQRDTLLAQHRHTSISSPSLIHSASVSTQPSHSQPHTKGKYW